MNGDSKRAPRGPFSFLGVGLLAAATLAGCVHLSFNDAKLHRRCTGPHEPFVIAVTKVVSGWEVNFHAMGIVENSVQYRFELAQEPLPNSTFPASQIRLYDNRTVGREIAVTGGSVSFNDVANRVTVALQVANGEFFGNGTFRLTDQIPAHPKCRATS